MEVIIQFSKRNERDLEWILSQVSGRKFAEIGCWTGHSTSIIAREAERRCGFVMVVDWFQGNADTDLEQNAKDNDILSLFKSNMDRLGLLKSINIFNGRSEDMHRNFPDGSLDFLFIDAGHTYEEVKADLDLYLPKMARTGIIAGHDYEHHEYEERWIDRDAVAGRHHGVIKAVNEKFGKRVRRMGSIWLVDLGDNIKGIDKFGLDLKTWLAPPYRYSGQEFVINWVDDQLKRQ